MPPRAADTENLLVSELASPAPTERVVLALAASHAPAPRRREVSTPIAPVLGLSVLAHVLVAFALGALDPMPVLASLEPTFVEVEMAPAVAPAEPIAEPEPLPPPPEPVTTPAPTLRARPEPTPAPVAPTPEPPPPEPSAAPPSVDDVFGAEPAPSAEVMGAMGESGGPAMDLGSAGGVPGGRAGGTGEGVGPGGGTGHAVASGPSEADRRRARRAYVRSLEGLLGGRVRYPRAAARDRLEGRAELCLRIGDDGRVLGRRICNSSGHDLLDDAALSAAEALDRVPAPPALAACAPTDEVHAGVQFRIQ